MAGDGLFPRQKLSGPEGLRYFPQVSHVCVISELHSCVSFFTKSLIECFQGVRKYVGSNGKWFDWTANLNYFIMKI